MNEILGYGEDALTLWALKTRLRDILEKLHDQTDPSDCLIFYRPSFGRRGGRGRAEFGEFDAILASSGNIYLIESKWDKSSENKVKSLRLCKKDDASTSFSILSYCYLLFNYWALLSKSLPSQDF